VASRFATFGATDVRSISLVTVDDK
jgi:hypothetical protein